MLFSNVYGGGFYSAQRAVITVIQKSACKAGALQALKSNHFAVFDAYCELPLRPLSIVRASVPHALFTKYVTVGNALIF